MLNTENKNTSYHDVMPAVARFVGERTFKRFTEELPVYMQDNFERFMETVHDNDLKMREKVKRCLNPIGQFSITMAPFNTNQVYEACKEQGYE